MKNFLLAFLSYFLIASTISGKIYKCYDKNHKVLFTNLPCVSHIKPDYKINIMPTYNLQNIKKWVNFKEKRKNFKVLNEVKRNREIHIPIVLTYNKPVKKKDLNISSIYKLIHGSRMLLNVKFKKMQPYFEPIPVDSVVLNPILKISFDKNDEDGEYTIFIKFFDKKIGYSTTKKINFILH